MITEAPHIGILDQQPHPVFQLEETPPTENPDRKIAHLVQTGQEAFYTAAFFYPHIAATDERFIAAKKHALLALLPKDSLSPKEHHPTTTPPDIEDLYQAIAKGMQTVTDVANDNVALIRHIANKAVEKYGKTGDMTVHDYIHIGIEGAMKATVRYDANRGPFSSYLGAKIDFAMRDAHKAATHATRLLPDDMITLVSLDKSLDGDSEAQTLKDTLPATHWDHQTETKAILNDTYHRLSEVIQEMTPNEQVIFRLHNIEGYKLTEIKDQMNLSSSRISQIKNEALQKVREKISHPFEDERPA